MGFIVSSQVQTSIGVDINNLWCSSIFHTQELLITGKVQCDISFHRSEADHDSKKDSIYPIVDNKKVTNCTIQLQLSDIIKESGQSTMSDVVTFFYAKLKQYLETTYNWTII